jgi:glycosyltransferase involved in cell wall biosynthesis
VLTTRGADGAGPAGVTVHPIMRRWSWSELPRLRRFARGLAPDAVLLMYIGWTYNYEFMITFAPTFLKSVLPGVPFVTRFENFMGAEPARTGLAARLLRKAMAIRHGRRSVNYGFGTLLRDSDGIIVLADRHRRMVRDNFPAGVERPIDLIPPAPNMRLAADADGAARRRGRERLGLEADDPVVAYIGYIHAGKGLETLLGAFRRVSQERPCWLVMIGGAIAAESGNPESYLEELTGLAARLGVAERVRWTGAYAWDGEDASLYLRAADVCVLPFKKGINLNSSSTASVMAHGMPVVTTRGAVLEDPFVHGDNVFLCPPDSEDALAEAMTAVLEDTGLQQRLRAGARRLAARFSWDATVERTLQALRPA